jgi:hypothetical protein
MNKEGITPVCTVVWTDLHKPDDHGYYGVVVAMKPNENDKHKDWLGGVKEIVTKELTDPAKKPPYWEFKKEAGQFRIRFSSKFDDFAWYDAEDQEIERPRRLDTGTEVQVKYIMKVSPTGKYLNCYLQGIKIHKIPAKNEAPDGGKGTEYEDPDAVPF